MSTVKFFINDTEVEAQDGERLLDAALKNGFEIPYFCYHPALKVAGNCRLCLVEQEGVPKLQPACNTAVKAGIKIYTESEKVVKTRALMLELFTKNHPLDCPVCDKSGECMLQDYVYKYGEKRDRYKEQKRVYNYQYIGDKIERNMDRCIMCTRCERFMRDVAGSEDYGMFERGAKTSFNTFISDTITGNHQGNLHDICPVGALTTKDFRFKKRVWYLEKTDSVCPLCATGCNIEVHHHKNQIFRVVPRTNEKVNGHFMCDAGRFGYHKYDAENRLSRPMSEGKEISLGEALDSCAAMIGASKKCAVVGGANLTNEDLFIVKKFVKSAKPTELYDYRVTQHQKNDDYSKEDFLVSQHKRPNSRGAKHLGLIGSATVDDILARAKKKEIDLVIVLEEDLLAAGALKEKLTGARVIVLTSFKSDFASSATLALPIKGFAETSGSFVNFEGYVQKKKRAVAAPSEALETFRVFLELASKMGKPLGGYDSYEAIAEEMKLPERI